MGYGKPVKATGNKSAGTSAGSGTTKKTSMQVPERIPPIFDGSQLLVFGVFENPDEKPTWCTITAESPDGPLSVEIEVRGINLLAQVFAVKFLSILKQILFTLITIAFRRKRPRYLCRYSL